ncbi:unnamed protein product [Boreogadus saida]
MSKLGYEHYYNAEDGSGYLALRIKTLQKEASEGRPKRSRQSQTGGPRYDDMLAIFPRFMDIPGLIDQDFRLLFGDSTSAKLLEKWSTNIKPKVIAQSRDLTQTEEVKYLIQNAVATEVEEGWFFLWSPSEDRHLSISPFWLLSIFCQRIIIHIAIPSCNTLPGLPHLTSIGVVGTVTCLPFSCWFTDAGFAALQSRPQATGKDLSQTSM